MFMRTTLITWLSWAYFRFLMLLEVLWEYIFRHFCPNVPESVVLHRFQRHGVLINGERQWDIQVLDNRFYIHMFLRPILGLGEAFMSDWWESDDLDTLFLTLNKFGYFEVHGYDTFFSTDCLLAQFHHLTVISSRGSKDVRTSKDTYFPSFLGSIVSFSCGMWESARTLEASQLANFSMIAEKLQLRPGMSVLDIGCGWGALAKYLAQVHSVSVTCCTTFRQQAEFAKSSCEGLRVRILCTKFTRLHGKFDRIVSLANFHFMNGPEYREFFKHAAKLMKRDSVFLLQMVGVNHHHVSGMDPWTRLYLFPDLQFPYFTDICHAIDGLFVMEQLKNIGMEYTPTIGAWVENLDKLHRLNRRGRKYRMWVFFLKMQASLFKLRKLQVWQIVLSQQGMRRAMH